MRALGDYRTLVFDCDGVVLDSNRLKTDAFRTAALPYGDAAARALVDHHVARGGISRYLKFSHFLDDIVPRTAPDRDGPDLDGLLQAYAAAVREGLLTCEVAPGLEALRRATPDARWLIVSGGDQAELREVFAARGLDTLFDGGIFGSPDAKDAILAREMQAQNIRTPALFLGDSRYDHEAARGAGLDFRFVSGWSEFDGWPAYCAEHGIETCRTPADLMQAAPGQGGAG